MLVFPESKTSSQEEISINHSFPWISRIGQSAITQTVPHTKCHAMSSSVYQGAPRSVGGQELSCELRVLWTPGSALFQLPLSLLNQQRQTHKSSQTHGHASCLSHWSKQGQGPQPKSGGGGGSCLSRRRWPGCRPVALFHWNEEGTQSTLLEKNISRKHKTRKPATPVQGAGTGHRKLFICDAWLVKRV